MRTNTYSAVLVSQRVRRLLNAGLSTGEWKVATEGDPYPGGWHKKGEILYHPVTLDPTAEPIF